MIDETNLTEERQWLYESHANKAIASLKRVSIDGVFVWSKEEALAKALELIPPGASVGRGDSVTLAQIGLMERLRKDKSREIIDPFERDESGRYAVPGPGHMALMRKAATADVFLTGVNAITMDGKLVNVDSIGNRVVGLIFGPKKVIVVAGANKIVKNVDEALERLRRVSPLNVRRHYVKHAFESLEELPCLKTGVCVDCRRPDSICNYVVIVQGQQAPKGAADYLPRIHVIIVGEDLGI